MPGLATFSIIAQRGFMVLNRQAVAVGVGF